MFIAISKKLFNALKDPLPSLLPYALPLYPLCPIPCSVLPSLPPLPACSCWWQVSWQHWPCAVPHNRRVPVSAGARHCNKQGKHSNTPADSYAFLCWGSLCWSSSCRNTTSPANSTQHLAAQHAGFNCLLGSEDPGDALAICLMHWGLPAPYVCPC
jgi:hypothetical protein